ncbi:unnamed protein product [Allacma fusca]|uniref:Uncharacterized protein n=1 Tax=Allacma fusca TaxID=39272 RepID=A0A8J2KSI3_9HEXA|nr:unnamed protein product [Allacma fusca]
MLAPEWRSSTIKFILTSFEALLPLVVLLNAAVLLFIDIIFFQNCVDRVLNGMQRISLGTRRLLISIQELRDEVKNIVELQLWIQLFNLGRHFNMFGYKIYCITMTIFFTSIGIYSMHYSLFYAIMYLGISFELTTAYVTIFDKAFAAPASIQKFKRKILITAKLMCSRDAPFICRRIRAIPNIGFLVGDFNKLERASTPNFIIFVVLNTVRVLIAFKH